MNSNKSVTNYYYYYYYYGVTLQNLSIDDMHNHRRPLILSVGVDSILARLACKMLYTHRNKCYSYLNHCLDHLSGLQVLRMDGWAQVALYYCINSTVMFVVWFQCSESVCRHLSQRKADKIYFMSKERFQDRYIACVAIV